MKLHAISSAWLSTIGRLIRCVLVSKSKFAGIGTLLLPAIDFLRWWWSRCLSIFNYFIIIIVINIMTIIVLISSLYIRSTMINAISQWQVDFPLIEKLISDLQTRSQPSVLARLWPCRIRYVLSHWLKTLCVDQWNGAYGMEIMNPNCP